MRKFGSVIQNVGAPCQPWKKKKKLQTKFISIWVSCNVHFFILFVWDGITICCVTKPNEIGLWTSFHGCIHWIRKWILIIDYRQMRFQPIENCLCMKFSKISLWFLSRTTKSSLMQFSNVLLFFFIPLHKHIPKTIYVIIPLTM